MTDYSKFSTPVVWEDEVCVELQDGFTENNVDDDAINWDDYDLSKASLLTTQDMETSDMGQTYEHGTKKTKDVFKSTFYK